ncbi:MAG: hypothetical protein KHZ90_08645 [Veillonella parvula]|uniref:Uncharacterized protein n=1 Tax=Veillonella parvula TaxID=29466 RepID=A0A943A3S7_VEIPA|nr:hypothetical protein [Veillonella parvula]MBS4893830.1 hypothetical protein [Veillonella parvula]
MMNKKFYIYNFVQVDFFLQNGLIAIGAGIGKSGKPFVVFVRDQKCEEVFSRWCERSNILKCN